MPYGGMPIAEIKLRYGAAKYELIKARDRLRKRKAYAKDPEKFKARVRKYTLECKRLASLSSA